MPWSCSLGKINLGNAGTGSASHLCGLLFQSALQVDMTTIPYKGTAPAMNDLLGGQIDLMCDQTTNTTGQIEAKKIKAYAVTPKNATEHNTTKIESDLKAHVLYIDDEEANRLLVEAYCKLRPGFQLRILW